MGFNYGLEKKNFDRQWAIMRKQYEDAGMSMRLKDNNNPFIHVNPPYQLMVIHSSKLVYPRELYQRGVERKRVELIAAHFNEYAETEKTAELMDNVSKLYEELISFSDLYDSASFEAKKMIVNQLIRRVDVYRGYQLNITFNFDLTPYIEGDDAAAC